MAQRHSPFECRTIDGITLRGWFYAVAGPAPAIVMTHGVGPTPQLSHPISPCFLPLY